MKKTFLSLLSVVMLFGIVACSPEQSTTNNGNSSSTHGDETTDVKTETKNEDNSSQDSSQADSQTDDMQDIHRATISFAGMTPTGKFDSSDVRNEFVQWFNKQCANQQILSSVGGEATVETKLGGELSQYHHLCLGGKTSQGTLEFNFAQPIKEISFGACAFWKTWSDSHSSGFNVDLNTSFEVLSGTEVIDSKDLPSTANQEPEIVEISKVLETPLTQFSVRNVVKPNNPNNRVFLETITIVW